MASAYKTAARREASPNGSVDDMSDTSEDTLQAEQVDGDHNENAASLARLPVEVRNRILLLTSRGVSHRHRHLLNDLHTLLPHTYKDTKLDTKSSNNYNATLNALADLNSCNYVFFLEARKNGQDLYLWLARAPNGPTIKFNVANIHTMGELGFGGNCLKGGRGVVVFDKSFEDNAGVEGEHKTLIREMLRGVFCVPSRGIRGMKPFIDRVIGIYGLDGKIWIRVYEIREAEQDKATTTIQDKMDVTLIEVGPRMVLTPVVILEGSFGGPVIYENKQFVSPNQIRSAARLSKASKYARRRGDVEDRAVKRHELGLDQAGRRQPSSTDNAVLFS